MAIATYKDLCIDAVDAATLGRFWAAALGLDLELHDDGDAKLTGPTPAHTVWINTVPEPVTVEAAAAPRRPRAQRRGRRRARRGRRRRATRSRGR